MLMKYVAVTAAALGLTASAQAAFVFSFGSATPVGGNLYNVPLSVSSDSGTASIAAANLIIRSNDGGAVNGGTSTSPTITAITFPTTAGNLFAGSTDGTNSAFESVDLVATRNFILGNAPATVNVTATPQVVANITVNTTLIANLPGIPVMSLSTGSALGNSTLTLPSGATATPAVVTQIVTVPEPASLAVLSGAGLMLLRRKRA